jgi:GTP cyclohydrolase I
MTMADIGDAVQQAFQESVVRQFLDTFVPNWRDDKDMADTPSRVTKYWKSFYQEPDFNFTVFPNKDQYDQIILQKDIPFSCVCSHHLLPFIGKAHVAYIPDKRYVGLSKLARTVRHFSRTVGTQEMATQHIGKFLTQELKPIGCAVIVEAEHLCMRVRGVYTDGVITTTSFMEGAFREKAKARAELMSLIYGK